MKSTRLFETERLFVRTATVKDAGVFYDLWNSPQVMALVGYPRGMQISKKEIIQRLQNNPGYAFGSLLVVCLFRSGQVIGESWLGTLNTKKETEPDVKLLPEFWGHKFGVEVWKGLVEYIFANSDCKIIQATPNVKNIASIKMQEAAGGVRVNKGVFHFADELNEITTPVHYFTYHIYRPTLK